uniref:DDE Tnp4 domain-containing protein n=1 Tax=Cyclopterus lumpus TaxID=8103 RepID=A0A8C3AWE6_CYCLU
SFRVGVSTVSSIVPDVATAIWDCLVEEFMAVPTTEDWRSIAVGFEERWNFPLCCGALDGKHVVLKARANSASQFFNYKGTFSLVLLAVVDAQYCFRLIDVGGYGITRDGGILANSAFGQALKSGNLQLPADLPLPDAVHRGPQPHVFVADEAFPLRKTLMRPFPGRNLLRERRIFNYRLSQARLVHANVVLANVLHANVLHANVLHANMLQANVLHAIVLHGNILHANVFNVLHANVVLANILHANVLHANILHANIHMTSMLCYVIL